MKSMKLGGGGRFQKLKGQLKAKNHNLSDDDAEALASWIGRKKLGKKKFQRLSEKGE